MSIINEIEAKYSVRSFSAVRKALRGAGAKYLGTVLQTDQFYEKPDRAFRRSGCGLRLRCIKILKRGDVRGDSRPLITFKGPIRGNSGTKIRREIETKLDCATAAAELFCALGLRPTMTIQKSRSSYKLGRCLIELDELPLLGKFIEIEGISERNVETTRKRLGIRDRHIPQSYLRLLTDRCRELKITSDVVTFERFPRTKK